MSGAAEHDLSICVLQLLIVRDVSNFMSHATIRFGRPKTGLPNGHPSFVRKRACTHCCKPSGKIFAHKSSRSDSIIKSKYFGQSKFQAVGLIYCQSQNLFTFGPMTMFLFESAHTVLLCRDDC